MDKQLAIRRVRIAVSVFFGVLTVALCVLWVRSYFSFDIWKLQPSSKRPIVVGSAYGHVTVSFRSKVGTPMRRFMSQPLQLAKWESQRVPRVFQFLNDRVVVPHWFVALLLIGLSATPWISQSRRFSLRTMLIATTLVAVVLELGVWLAR